MARQLKGDFTLTNQLLQDHPHYFPQPFPSHMVNIAESVRVWQTIAENGRVQLNLEIISEKIVSFHLFSFSYTHFAYSHYPTQDLLNTYRKHFQLMTAILSVHRYVHQMYSSVKINVNLCFSLLVHLIFNVDDSVLGTNDYSASFPGFAQVSSVQKSMGCHLSLKCIFMVDL